MNSKRNHKIDRTQNTVTVWVYIRKQNILMLCDLPRTELSKFSMVRAHSEGEWLTAYERTN